MTRTAIVDTVSGRVLNVIELDPEADFILPDGQALVQQPGARFGATWDGSEFSAPEPAADPVPSSVSKLQAELAAGQEAVEKVEAFMHSSEYSTWGMSRAWSSSSELHRDSETVKLLAWFLNWDDVATDAFFIAAAQIKV